MTVSGILRHLHWPGIFLTAEEISPFLLLNIISPNWEYTRIKIAVIFEGYATQNRNASKRLFEINGKPVRIIGFTSGAKD